VSLNEIQAALAHLSPEELETLREGIERLRDEQGEARQPAPPPEPEEYSTRRVEPFYQNRKLANGGEKRYGPYFYEVEYTYRKGKRPLKKKVKYLGKKAS
jgi:hypothetical protein